MGETDIGIIVAMSAELKPFCDRIGLEFKGAAGDFSLGKIGGLSVVLGRSGVGKVHAARCAALMIERYSPRMIVNSGSAGGFVGNFGEIVIADAAVQHDFDLTGIGGKLGEIPECGRFFECHEPLSRLFAQTAQALSLAAHRGTVLTGDRFMQNGGRLDRILAEFPSAAACEMEAAAVGQVCAITKTPFAVIRAISDLPKRPGNCEDFDTFLPKAAENCARLVCETLFLAEKEELFI